jgi:uncharacterized protein YhjY with autotransporter beta-barrel domain
MRTDPTVRPWTGFLIAVAALAATAAPAAAQQGFELLPVSATTQSLSAGRALQLRVQLLDPSGLPFPGQPIAWRVASSDAGAYGPSQSITDSNGVAVARFHFPQAGTTVVEASYGGLAPVQFTVVSTAVAPPPPRPSPPLVLTAVGATERSLVLGDRDEFGVLVSYESGGPAAGVEVLFAIESSPGSPGVGRSDQTLVTDSSGVARASYGFSTAGRVEIRVSVPNAQVPVTPDSILFTVEVASLGSLTPERNTYRTAGEALDQVCRDVFVDSAGNQRPEPRPTPLCVYMTGTLQDREQRAEAVRTLTNTGLGSQSTTALSGIELQTGAVQSRLAALRGGGLRSAAGQIALQIDGVGLSNGTFAGVREQDARRDLFEDRLERSFARLYAGLDADSEPAGGTAEEPAEAPQIAPRRERPWGFFVTGRLTRGKRVEGAEETGFDFDTKGATLGFDRAVSANGFLGLALSGLRNTTDLRGGGGTLDGDSVSATFYAIHEGEKGYVQLTASYGRTRFDQKRPVALPVVGTLEARAEFDGDQLASTLELGRSIDGSAGSLTFFARGSWARASIDGFRETGAVATIPGSGFGPVDFGLEVADQRLDSLLGEGGLDWGKAISVAHGLVIPQLTVTWAHEFDHDAQRVRARFLGDTAAGSSFFVFTDPPDRDWLTASAALRFQFLWGSFFVSYDHDFQRADLETSTYNAGLRFEF